MIFFFPFAATTTDVHYNYKPFSIVYVPSDTYLSYQLCSETDVHYHNKLLVYYPLVSFQTYNVDLAMWAHVHCYQRTCQVYQEECVDGAPVHVVIGMGGRDLAQGAMP